mmetsp:Transcript_6703/g.7272  ORF Transcript_6703/g.7272 Transcript_6703/m.7272 type:complete len:276 (+) Transcript_6703:70-897(+)
MIRLWYNKDRISLVLLFVLGLTWLQVSYSYPIIFEATSNQVQCIDLNIPDGDDAHILMLPISDDTSPEAEDFYVSEMAELSRHQSSQFLKELNPLPSNLDEEIKRSSRNSKVSITVKDPSGKSTKNYPLTHFKLLKILNVAKTMRAMVKHRNPGWDQNYGQYNICVRVSGRAHVRLLFDAVKISEYLEKMQKQHVLKKDHLTPLEEAFDEGIALAKSVLDEMYYMEKREIRMKQTTDGTNSRILYFSYMSIFILLAVTWIQINYLKGYFKKKKVL